MSKRLLIHIFCLCLLQAAAAQALTFSDDMVDNQMRAGVIMKPKVAGSVPVGGAEEYLANMTEAEGLSNPLKDSKAAIKEGHSLFTINCAPCHGDISKAKWEPSPAGKLFILKAPPNIGSAEFKDRSDGRIYGAMYFGFGLMPRVGYKLSSHERWSIVSYIRSVQGAK